MLYSKYCLFITNLTRMGEKIINQRINVHNFIKYLSFKQLEITFRVSSNSKYEHGFITMLMLTEKMLNHIPVFLLDKHTLSRNKVIKIGLVLTLKNEMIDYYLKLCCIHSVPKFYSHGIFFNISHKTNNLSYTMNKILSNTLFSFDKDINSYYDYLGELPFEFSFLFRTYFRHISMNKLLVSNSGIHFINEINSNVLLQTREIADIIAQEEESDDDLSTLEYDMNDEIIEYKNDDDFSFFEYESDMIDEIIEYESESDDEVNKDYYNSLAFKVQNTDIDEDSYTQLYTGIYFEKLISDNNTYTCAIHKSTIQEDYFYNLKLVNKQVVIHHSNEDELNDDTYNILLSNYEIE